LATRAKSPTSAEGEGALARRARSFGYAFAGLRWLVRTQPNFRIHLALAALAVVLALVLHVSPAELGLLALTIGLVLALEAINTALEALCDVASPTYHPLVGVAKDVSAAAVLLAALSAVLVALALFGPRLLALL
jgi:diacylglycerol kinase (ATP)